MIAVDLGIIPYDRCLSYQERIHSARSAGRIDDVLLLLEHLPVITIGRNGGDEDLLASPGELESRGVIVRCVDRGGKTTCHYPGQLVGYLLMGLGVCGNDVHALMGRLEDALIWTLSEFGLRASRREGLRGVWIGAEKIASIGLSVKRDVTMHGFSLNVSSEARYFSLILPCGLKDAKMTSMESALSSADGFSIPNIKRAVIRHLARALNINHSGFLSATDFTSRYGDVLQ